ncbi:MAG: glutathione S-transferase family protein [Pseudomonadota bacterium]
MKIYGRMSSINVQKVTWCLGEMGLVPGKDYERIDAGLHFGVNNTAEYREMTPTGLVPTLVEGDFVLWESNAIVRYLVARQASPLWPADPQQRASADRWMDWSLSDLWPALRIAFIGMTRTPEDKRDYKAIRAGYEEGSRLVAGLDHYLRKQAFCAGDSFTVGDIAAGVAVHRWFGMAEQFPDALGARPEFAAVTDWYRNRIATRPAFQACLG